MSKSLKQMAYDTIEAHQETIADLRTQLAKANERVSELEQELLHHKNVNRDIHLKNSGIATLVSELTGNSVVLPKMKTRGEIKSALNKFAIETRTKALQYLLNKKCPVSGYVIRDKESREIIAEELEQLRKEQE